MEVYLKKNDPFEDYLKDGQLKLLNNSFFFFRYKEKLWYDSYREKYIDDSKWVLEYFFGKRISLQKDYFIDSKQVLAQYKLFKNNSLKYCLCIPVIQNPNNKSEDISHDELLIVSLKFRLADSQRIEDWERAFDSTLLEEEIGNKYYFKVLLWMLDNLEWNVKILIESINHFERKWDILSVFCKIGKCLAFYNQENLKEVCKSFGVSYGNISLPFSVYKFVDNIRLGFNSQVESIFNENIFGLCDVLFSLPNSFTLNDSDYSPVQDNPLIVVLKWLSSDRALADYSVLEIIFPLLSTDDRLQIIRHYFENVEKGHTILDWELLSRFKSNEHEEYVRFRHCLEQPDGPVNIGVPLLCDIVETLFNTKGELLQDYNGLLDTVVTKCDVSNPDFDPYILPTCNGLVRNKQFKGFIDFAIVRKIDESLLTDEKIKNAIQIILGFSTIARKGNIYCEHCNYQKIASSKDIWIIPKGGFVYSFLNETIDEETSTVCITLEMLSCEKLREYIVKLFDEKGEAVISSEWDAKPVFLNQQQEELKTENYCRSVVSKITEVFQRTGSLETDYLFVYYFSTATRMRIVPLEKTKREFGCPDGLINNIIASLRKDLNVDIINDEYFEIPYDRKLLVDLTNLYFFNAPKSSDCSDDYNDFFLRDINNSRKFCAPMAKNFAVDHVTGMPFYYCHGWECFSSNMSKPGLLFYVMDVLKYPKLEEIRGDFTVKQEVATFFATVGKVKKIYYQLRCRTCGHLLFAGEKGSFGHNNFFSCRNPECGEYKKSIYLNYCYKCRTGIIDSRDVKRCPNGMYICQKCGSCCDDELFARHVQRYYMSKRQVPQYIRFLLGHGHNDKGIFFCYKCGQQLKEGICLNCEHP